MALIAFSFASFVVFKIIPILVKTISPLQPAKQSLDWITWPPLRDRTKAYLNRPYTHYLLHNDQPLHLHPLSSLCIVVSCSGVAFGGESKLHRWFLEEDWYVCEEARGEGFEFEEGNWWTWSIYFFLWIGNASIASDLCEVAFSSDLKSDFCFVFSSLIFSLFRWFWCLYAWLRIFFLVIA